MPQDVEALNETVRKCLVDASQNVRATARSVYFEFSRHWPDEVRNFVQLV